MKILATNKKASFNYHILDEFTAGIQLFGTEVKSMRNAQVSLQEGYCFITKELEVLCTGLYIKEYKQAFKNANHDPYRVKKLLLNKHEIRKIYGKMTQKSETTIIPLRLFITSRGFIKMDIGLCVGKKKHDKRADLKEKDIQRQIKTGNKGGIFN